MIDPAGELVGCQAVQAGVNAVVRPGRSIRLVGQGNSSQKRERQRVHIRRGNLIAGKGRPVEGLMIAGKAWPVAGLIPLKLPSRSDCSG